MSVLIISLSNIIITRHVQHDKHIYGTESDRKLKAYINHLLNLYKSSPELI